MAEFTGVFHVHSTFSDGEMTLTQIRDWAVAAELDFVCVTDHAESLPPGKREEFFKECERLSTETLLVPGIEFAHSGRHVIALAPSQCLSNLDDAEVVDNPDTVRKCGGITIWAHPAFTFDLSLHDGAAARYDGWEVWSLKHDGGSPNLPVLALLEETARQWPVLAFAGWDLHGVANHDIGPRIRLSIATDKLTQDGLLTALCNGSFCIESDTCGSENSCLAVPFLWRGAISWLQYCKTRFSCVARYLGHRVKTYFGHDA